MKFYLAPMEGITGYIYRNAYHKYFHNVDKYFTPFITPHTKRCLNAREKNDILPEHNEGMKVIPQVLTNQAEDFVEIARTLQEYGYDEINLNLGCPSGTVVSRKRGAGFLAYPKELELFLDENFCKIGYEDFHLKPESEKRNPGNGRTYFLSIINIRWKS